MREGAREAARAVERIRAHEQGTMSLNAFLSIAREVDVEGAAGGGMLSGAAVAVKDNLVTTGLPTTCASKLLEGYVSPFEATVVRRLREAGGVVVGKTNLDEFGMGSSTENSAFGPTLNPLDRSRVPGGSSGGSAAAVAAGHVRMALGSDTGGSVRQPAAFCGVVGIKPTYGRVSRYGLVAFASSLDHVGTLGRTVRDAAALLQAVAGHDPRDATSAERPVPDLLEACSRGVSGTVVGVPREFMESGLSTEMVRCVDEAVERLRGAGAEVRDVSLPHTPFAIPAYYVLAPAEASSNLSRFDGIRYGRRKGGDGSLDDVYALTRTRGFGREVKRRIVLGTHALSAGYHARYYGRAQRARGRIAEDLQAVFRSGIDVLFSPTTPGSAFALGERFDDPMAMYLSDVFTVTANLAGVPAMSVPIGVVDGLPVGGHIMAPWWDEEAMVAAGAALEASWEGGAP
jgi:aspartyl-tRNA(Asn)/glutamyl-tRNA(Gln) amidotransferase subunit A